MTTHILDDSRVSESRCVGFMATNGKDKLCQNANGKSRPPSTLTSGGICNPDFNRLNPTDFFSMPG